MVALWFVPLPRPQCFVGREEQLAQLSAHISSEGCRKFAIYGLGGCGKTALALETAYQTREQQPTRAIFWVPAVSQESFEQAYREIGVLLRIPGISDAKADVKQLVRERLSDECFGQWLMIVDNADDVNVLFKLLEEGNGTERLIDYLPRSRKGSIVFTTRTGKAAIDLAENNVIALGELSEREAKEIVRTRLLLRHQHQVEDEEMVREFLGILAFLAIAIVQAVAFINQNDSKLSDYVLLYRASEQEASQLLSEEFQDPGRYQETRNPVATTWYVSFQQIREGDKLAADYLSFMACTASNDIPESMLPSKTSSVAQTKALGTLKAYAFITERETARDGRRGQQEQMQRPARTFDVHPLVHLAMRGWLQVHHQWLHWVERVMARLLEVLPSGDSSKIGAWMPYLPHATHVAGLDEVSETKAILPLLARIGSCEQTLGRYKAAELACQQVLRHRLRDEKIGKEHPDTLTSMNNLAEALSNQGKYAEAEVIFQETLALREKVLGKEHPNTLMSMSNLAQTLSYQGKYAEAEVIFQETLALGKKLLGKEHPKTLMSMSNLAQTLSYQGKYAEAEVIFRETLALLENVLGKEHPGTLMSMNNLAAALLSQGKHAEATVIYQETLVLRKKVLGKEHPDTLMSMNNLAHITSDQGNYAEAKAMHQETLALLEKVLGKEHPHTLTSMNNLAGALSGQGKYAEAEVIFQETLALREKVLGKEHPHTLKSMGNLALVLSRQRKHKSR
jgi:tetratricopeptide (TPR) repeat protein